LTSTKSQVAHSLLKGRYLLCQRLRQRCPDHAALQRVSAQTYVGHHGVQVYTESFYPRGLEAAQYIGRYLGHPPLATSHLTAYDSQQVTYWYLDTATKVKQTVTCSALNFISRLVPHIPPRECSLCAMPAFMRIPSNANAPNWPTRPALEPLRKVLPNPKWREGIKASFGFDPLACPRCGQIMQLAEIWEPKRGHVWMRRWLETHRAIKTPREAFADLHQRPLDRYQQLGLGFPNTS
jgi:hypothetical protein